MCLSPALEQTLEQSWANEWAHWWCKLPKVHGVKLCFHCKANFKASRKEVRFEHSKRTFHQARISNDDTFECRGPFSCKPLSTRWLLSPTWMGSSNQQIYLKKTNQKTTSNSSVQYWEIRFPKLGSTRGRNNRKLLASRGRAELWSSKGSSAH